jgi:hypothetical protein
MRVANSASAIISRLTGDDLVVRPMPASGLLMPGANDAIVTGDGIVVVDSKDNPLYFITTAGLVIGRSEHILRDSELAAATLHRAKAEAAKATASP